MHWHTDIAESQGDGLKYSLRDYNNVFFTAIYMSTFIKIGLVIWLEDYHN